MATADFSSLKIPTINPNDLVRAAIMTGVPAALAALGTVQGDAALIANTTVRVSGADGATGVRLPVAHAGKSYIVVNTGASTLKVYPPTGAAIDAGAANAAASLGAKLAKVFLFTSDTAVETLDTSVVEATSTAIQTQEMTFTETAGAGVYTGSVVLPAGATIHDIIVSGVALWDNAGAVTLKVGDTDDDGFYTAVNLKATDLLAGESLSFALAGGKAGAYIANSQVSPRYSATARTISGIITTASTGGSTGRTRITVAYSVHAAVTAATKV